MNDCKTKRKTCGDCRYYLENSGVRDDDCVNVDSPKYDIGIDKYDSCPEFEQREKINAKA